MASLKRGGNDNKSQGLILWLVLTMIIAITYQSIQESPASVSKIIFSEFMVRVNENNIKEVKIKGETIIAKTDDGESVSTYIPKDYSKLLNELEAKKVMIEIQPTETNGSSFINALISWIPALLLVGVWIYFMRSMQGGGGKAMGFGKSKARLAINSNINFSSVAGVDEAKEELMELVEFLRSPKKFQLLGGKIPKGCLLVGHPGTGKTLLAKAVAGEANVPFFSISGSDFVEMFVGVGASRVRDMFAQAKKSAPCIIFIDEIDAVGRHRGAGLGGGNDEREQTLNQLLVEMDGFSDNQGVIVIAATNRPDVLDPALLRPGRFDRQITVPLPDIKGREQIIAVHAKKVPMADDVEFKTLARGTPGFSGADLANVINEAALLAARYNKNMVSMSDIEAARDKVMMGTERKSIVMKEEEIKLTAYHEGGHALVTIYSPASDSIHKATIIPRGRALGMVMSLPEDDQVSMTFEQMTSRIAILMGGRVAEEVIFGEKKVTSGASSDIKMATGLARRMVTQLGFSKEIGPVLVGDEREEVFLGHSLGSNKSLSENVTAKVDAEIRRFIEEGHAAARKIISEHLDELHLIAKNLIQHETLSGKEIKDLLAGKDISDAKAEQKKQRNSEEESKTLTDKKKPVKVKKIVNKIVHKIK